MPGQGRLNGILPGMAERRIPDIVRQAGSGNDGRQVGRDDMGGQRVLSGKPFSHQHAQGGADVGYLQAVGKAGAHVIVAPQRKHLRLILKAAESAGKQDAPVITVIIAAVLLRSRRALVA